MNNIHFFEIMPTFSESSGGDPVLLWILLSVAMTVFVVLSIILWYHWSNYIPHHTVAFRRTRWYYAAGIVLFFIALVAILIYHSSL